MDWKNFFWATKEKTVLTIVLFVLANIFFFPTDLLYEIVYLGFSFLIACIVFYFLKKGEKLNG